MDNDTCNAFCLPGAGAFTAAGVKNRMDNLLSRTGGKMVVFTGLLDKISSDHVLAFLMGHEFSHAICRCDRALAVTARLHLAATSQHRIR